MLARERGALRSCGADLAAHCINDVLTCGAEPLLFLDYVAANRIELEQVAELVEGAAEVCRDAGVRARRRRDRGAPGHLPRGRARLRGHLRRDRRARAADRRLADRGRRRRRRASRRRVSTRTASRWCAGSSRLEDYDGRGPARADPPLPRRRTAAPRTQPTSAASPMSPAAASSATSRASFPRASRAEIDWSSWKRPPVFGWLARHVEEDELRRVFNLGIGYVAVVPDPGDALVIGTIVRA